MLKKISKKRRSLSRKEGSGRAIAGDQQDSTIPASNTDSPRTSSSFEGPSSPPRLAMTDYAASTTAGAPPPPSAAQDSRQGSAAAGAAGVDPMSSSIISHFELPAGHSREDTGQSATSESRAAQPSTPPRSSSAAEGLGSGSGTGIGSASGSGSGSGSGGSSTVLAPRDVLQGQHQKQQKQEQQQQLQQELADPASFPSMFSANNSAAATTSATAGTAASRVPETTSRESAEDPITVATGNASGMPRILPRHHRMEEQQASESAGQTGAVPQELLPAIQHHHPAAYAYSHDDEKHAEEGEENAQEQDATNPPAAASGATPSAPPRTGSLTLSMFAPGISPLRRITLLLASLAINIGLPFVNGVALGFGEIFARTFVAPRLGLSLGINTMGPLPYGGRDGRSPVVNRMDAAEQEAMSRKAREEQQKRRR